MLSQNYSEKYKNKQHNSASFIRVSSHKKHKRKESEKAPNSLVCGNVNYLFPDFLRKFLPIFQGCF